MQIKKTKWRFLCGNDRGKKRGLTVVRFMAVEVTYLGATNHKGSRIRLQWHPGGYQDKPVRRYISFGYDFDQMRDDAAEWIEQRTAHMGQKGARGVLPVAVADVGPATDVLLYAWESFDQVIAALENKGDA